MCVATAACAIGIEDPTPLESAAEFGRVSEARILLKRGGDPNAGALGAPIIVAAARPSTEMLRLLISAGGDVNLDDGDGWRPLAAAAWNGHLRNAELLIENGADPCFRTSKEVDWAPGLGPSEVAQLGRHGEVAEYLAEQEKRDCGS